MLSPSEISVLVAAVGSGLVAGLCFAFASFIMRALDRLGASQAMRAMQAINATILRSSAMGVWFGTAVVGVVAIVLAEDRTLPIGATALYVVGAILITGRGNVPLNEATIPIAIDLNAAAVSAINAGLGAPIAFGGAGAVFSSIAGSELRFGGTGIFIDTRQSANGQGQRFLLAVSIDNNLHLRLRFCGRDQVAKRTHVLHALPVELDHNVT